MLIGLRDKKKQSGLPFHDVSKDGSSHSSMVEMVGQQGVQKGGANGRNGQPESDPKDPFLTYWP